MTLTTINRKNNPFLLSEQVKEILRAKGFLKVFNYTDYNYFKECTKNAFNKAQAIAERFIEDYSSTNESDFNEYVF